MSSAEETAELPRLLHLTWKSRRTLPPQMRANLDRWQALMPHWTVALYDDADLERLVARYCPQHLPAYRGFAKQIERVDFARPVMLAQHGGIYADMDMRPLRSFDDWLSVEADVVLALEPPEHYGREALLSNALMLSRRTPAARRFWDGFLDYTVRHYSKHAGAVTSTGPLALSRYVKQNSPAVQQCRLRVLGACEFNPTTDVLVRPELPLLSNGCRLDDAYTVHQWAHTWVEPARGKLAKRGSGAASAVAGLVLGLVLLAVVVVLGWWGRRAPVT